MSQHLYLYHGKTRGNSSLEYKTVDIVSSFERNECELSDAFGANESEYLKRVQFTLDGNMRGVVEFIADRRATSLAGAFQSALNFLYHLVNTGLASSGMFIERNNDTIEEVPFMTVFRYTEHLRAATTGTGKYQISLDHSQKEILDGLQAKLGMSTTSDVVRQALIYLYGVASILEDGDKVIFRLHDCDYVVEI